MTRTEADATREAHDDADEAALRFVRADARRDSAADAELAAWIAARPANERAMERVDLAVALARRLAADPTSALHAELQAAARPRSRCARAGRALAWGGALAAALLIAFYIVRDDVARPPEPAAIDAARAVAVDAPTSAAAVLPGGVVVDASAVAVLPFVSDGDAALAAGLERDVVEALRTVPGLYVIAGAAVAPYASTELAPAEVAGLLGARGLVEAAVELVDGRVRVSARLREAATGATLWQAQEDRPVDELRAVRTEIAQRVAAAMFDAAAREQVAERRDAAPSSAKPFQQ